MKTEVKKLENNTREIIVEVTGDIVKNKFEDVFKKLTEESKIPGFRPGKAPRDMVEKHYASAAHEQVLRELLPDVYNKAVDSEKLDVIEFPQISDVKLEKESLSFKATVEISPEFEVKNYKGIKIEHKDLTVTADEVKRSIDSIKETRKADAVDDNFAKALCYPNVLELEKSIERQILVHKDEHERRRIEEELIEKITKDLDFKLPQSLVKRQLEDLVKQTKIDLAMKGYPKEKIDEQENEMIKHLEPEAQKQVRVYLVLSRIAKKENIPVDDAMPRKVMEFLLREASWQAGS